MNSFLEPAVRFMNRLKYAYKFTIIGLLIFLQAFVLIYMLVAELNRTIELAEKERLGVQYEVVLADLLAAAQSYRTVHYEFLQKGDSNSDALAAELIKVDQALAVVVEKEKQVGEHFDTAWKVQLIQQNWLKRKEAALQLTKDQDQAAWDLDSRWIEEINDLMQHVGYASNLTMDSDFTTSYLIDVTLRKLPQLIDYLNLAKALVVQAPSESLFGENKNRVLQIVGLEKSTLDQISHDIQLVFRHDELVEKELKSLQSALADSVPIFAWNVEQKLIGQQGLPIPEEVLAATGVQAIQNSLALERNSLQVAEKLLAARIDRYYQYRNGVVFFSGTILLLVCYLFLGFDLSVRKAVYELSGVMQRVGQGDLLVRGRIFSKDEMAFLTNSINDTLDSLQKMYQEVQHSHACMEAWNQELEAKIAERTASLQSLLDHAGQGFLSFGPDLVINDEYSAECEMIFSGPIGGENISFLLYPDNEVERDFLINLFAKIFTEQRTMVRKTYLSLLPEEIILADRSIGLAYKLIEGKKELWERKIMLILTDLTLQKAMEQQIQAERDVLSMVVHVVTHSDDFFAAVKQYTVFCQEGMQQKLQEQKSTEDIFSALFRTVHTFKGSFGQLRMKHLMEKLHDMEDWLEQFRSGKKNLSIEQPLQKALASFPPEELQRWLEEELSILKGILGDSFFEQENRLVIESERLLELEAKVQQFLPPEECRFLLPELRKLRYKPFKELLQSYPEYTVALAERNEKAVEPFAIEGGESLVDPIIYQDFAKSLGHVFRNAVVHGLESLEERFVQGKDEIGHMRCWIHDAPDGMRLHIRDDGRGMNPEQIGDIAVQKKICTAEELAKLSEQQKLQLVFADGFSGSKKVSELAGRGVGLSAVLAELKQLHGTVEIHSTAGAGTEFVFCIPLIVVEDGVA